MDKIPAAHRETRSHGSGMMMLVTVYVRSVNYGRSGNRVKK